jgi:threonine/homoserine/homoserine lactone efflux protein
MFILLGIFVGLLASVPLGPVNVFVISQALKRDFFHGLLAGLTAAGLDTAFCFIALAGFFQIKLNLPPYAMSVLKVIAAVIILVLSAKLIHDSRTFEIPSQGDKIPSAAPKPIFGVLLLYVTNPTLYMFWVAVAGAVTGHHLVQSGAWRAVAFAAAVGTGSLFWYLGLVRFVSHHQSRIKPETFRRILLYLGLALAAFAIYTLGTVFI